MELISLYAETQNVQVNNARRSYIILLMQSSIFCSESYIEARES